MTYEAVISSTVRPAFLTDDLRWMTDDLRRFRRS